jgi:lipid A 3-O-deacylase
MLRPIRVLQTLLLFAVGTGLATAAPDGVHIAAVGARGAVSGTVNGHTFEQYDLDLRLSLPWEWQLPLGLMLVPQIDTAGSYQRSLGDSGFALFGGAVLALSKEIIPGLSLFAEIGTGPTLLTRHKFGYQDLGGPVQFTSHFSAGFQTGNLVLAARYQHMSNADLYTPNPGVDLRMVQLEYRF